MKEKESFTHTFALCAYKDSPYLEDCIQSLLSQSLPSGIIIATSTPTEHIRSMASKYSLSLFINPVSDGIAGDWNFAYKMAETAYVTIAHQDDLYMPDYAQQILQAAAYAKNPLILFTDYFERFNEEVIKSNKLLNIKRRMNFPLRCKAFQSSVFIRKRILSLGSSICCPSVTFHKKALGDFQFDSAFRCDLDWDAWSRIACQKGAFVYIPHPLMQHRIHERSETTNLLENGVRFEEDLAIFRRYWPASIAGMLMKHYKKSAENNEKS